MKYLASVVLSSVAAMTALFGRAEVISLTAGDAEGEHSFDTAGHWSDAAAPDPDEDYLVALGDDEVLRTPIVNITAAGSEAFTTFAGKSLTIGTLEASGAFYDFCYRYARLEIPELHLVNGTFWVGTDQTYWQAQNEQALYGTIHVESTADNPFTFRGLKPGDSGISLRGPLVGSEDSAICVAGKTYLAPCVSSPNFKGRFIVEGDARIWPGVDGTAENAFGSTPETFMKDAIILRNGGGIGSVASMAWDMKAQNRGIWVEGSAMFFSQGSYTISMPIGGGQLPSGKYLTIQPNLKAIITIAAPVTVYPLRLQNGYTLFTGDATIDDTAPVRINGGYLGTTVDRTVKVDYQGGGFYYSVSSQFSSLPVITLKEGSVWAQDKSSCALVISSRGFPMVGIDGWIPVLKVPTSVKDLSGVTFSVAGASGAIGTASVKVETVDGLQTVSVKPPTYYVVHPSTAGHVAVPPYTSWETAATNIADAVNEATQTTGGRVCVDRGVYDITEPISFATRWRKDAGSAWQENPVSLVGVNRMTMERDAEHVVLDGGYPARQNMIFSFGNAQGCSLVSLTLQHGCNANGGGGVGMLQSADSSFVVTGCRFLENHAKNGGVFQANVQMITNCYFKGNTASSGPSCLYNPQGSATVSGSYLNVVDCVFEENGNTTGNEAVFSGGRNTRFVHCTFRRCGRDGKNLLGMAYYSCVQDCIFEENGGVLSLGCSQDNPLVSSDLVFRNNDVGSYSLLSTGHAPLERVTIIGNTCKFAIDGSTANIRNFFIVSNTCSEAVIQIQDGITGVTYTWDSGTIVGNTANYSFRLAANSPNCADHTIVRNCVFWDNLTSAGGVAPFFVGLKAKTLAFTHSDVEGSVPSDYDDGTCFSLDPKFTADYRLKHNSPLREKALVCDWMMNAADLDGNPRILDRNGKVSLAGLPDIGCFECALPMPGLILILR